MPATFRDNVAAAMNRKVSARVALFADFHINEEKLRRRSA
jgi:hypothetical protein